ncbi:hypothetical protein DD238_000699 [Peronospora effusa]|uniref:COMM domain-containing protein n=1 Tax=Peronospora effusa TaxID=542832 RepID=A0A3M6VWP2_9STRA|nr:hypothetical protein DD238_000699 [Peronospora effusa]
MSSYAADERVLEAIALTSTLSVENFEAVSKLAMRLFSSDKQNMRQFARTASASGWESEQMEKVVLAIAKMFMDAAKVEMSEDVFRMVVKGMSLPEQHVEVLAKLYKAHVKDIRECVSRETGTSISQYRNLEWRIDLELGTRFHYNKPKPIVTLRLDTQVSSSAVPQAQTTCFRVDYDGLKLMQHQLETALKEVDSVHCTQCLSFIAPLIPESLQEISSVPRMPSWSLQELHQEHNTMESVLTEEKLRELAELCHLHIDDEKLPGLLKDVESIIQCTKTIQNMTINENDINDVYAKSDFDDGIVAPLRNDVVTEGDCVDQVMANAAEKSGYYFKVPKVLQN